MHDCIIYDLVPPILIEQRAINTHVGIMSFHSSYVESVF